MQDDHGALVWVKVADATFDQIPFGRSRLEIGHRERMDLGKLDLDAPALGDPELIAAGVEEDPVKPGLLFCGTERGVFVSFNAGDQWQPLQLNLPPSSMRDLAIKDDDLIVATHGRGFWILDNITPLRQAESAASADVLLFKPADAFLLPEPNEQGTPLLS